MREFQNSLWAQIRARCAGFSFFANHLRPKCYVDLQKNEPALPSSNLRSKASFEIPSMFAAFFLLISPIQEVGQRIWQNECGGTVEGLVFWNPKEEFPSLGIGHFIWLPKDKSISFDETFPELILFLQKEKVQVPNWMTKGCPWDCRESFIKADQQIKELRTLLASTIDLQMRFIVQRFEKAALEMGEVQDQINLLKSSPKGLFALIDYVNFKGTGLNPKERYAGKGWGLLQVLQEVPTNVTAEEALKAFVGSAKKQLAQRVKNAPKERSEERWLPAWQKRVDGYFLR